MLDAGQRSHRAVFQRALPGTRDWVDFAQRWAGVRPEFGGEQLAAGRLESKTNAVLTVLSDASTKQVTAADRIIFRTGPYRGFVGNITSIVASPDGREIEFLLEGVKVAQP